MKVVLVNQHTNNHGDEAAFLGLVSFFRSKSWQLVSVILNSPQVPGDSVIAESVDEVHAARVGGTLEKSLAVIGVVFPFLVGLGCSLSKTFGKTRRLIAESDVVVVGPGGENIGAYRDWLYLYNLQIALSLGKRVIFPGNSFGPSRSKLFDRSAIALLKGCRVVAREAVSLKYLTDSGVSPRLGADCALLLQPEYETKLKAQASGGEDRYAVVVPNFLWNWHPKFVSRTNELSQFCIHLFEVLTERYGKVKVLPQTFPYPSATENFDEVISEQLRDKVDIVRHADPHQQLSIVGGAQCLVGMRYHSVVFASMVGIPTFSFGYERKMLGFNKRFYDGKGFFDLAAGAAPDAEYLERLEFSVSNDSEIKKAIEEVKAILFELITQS